MSVASNIISKARSVRFIVAAIVFTILAVVLIRLLDAAIDTTSPIADTNGDSRVDIFDLSYVLGKWKTTDQTADFSNNGTVDIFDLSYMLSQWGRDDTNVGGQGAFYTCAPYTARQPSGGVVRNVANQSQLNTALRAARPGDTVNLATGTYSDITYRQSLGHTSGTQSAPIVIQAANGANPVINQSVSRGTRAVYIARRNHITVRGLTVRGGQFGMVAAGTVGVDFEHNDVSGVGDAAVVVQGYWQNQTPVASNSTVLCNTVHDTGLLSPEFSEGIYVGSGGNNLVDRTHDVLIKGNEVYNTKNESIDIKKYTYNVTIEDNMVHDGTPWYGGAITVGMNKDSWQSGNYVIQRNRIWNISTGRDYANAIAIAHGNSVIRNNVLWNIDTNATTGWPWRHVVQLHNDDSAHWSAYGFGNPNARTVEIYNNTIWGCEQDCINNYLESGVIAPSLTSRNNLISAMGGGVVTGSTDRRASSGDFVGPITGTADAGSGPGSGFNIRANSSISDSGEVISSFDDDIYDISRPAGLGWSFGAFEQ